MKRSSGIEHRDVRSNEMEFALINAEIAPTLIAEITGLAFSIIIRGKQFSEREDNRESAVRSLIAARYPFSISSIRFNG